MARPKGIPAHNKIATPINDLDFLRKIYIDQGQTLKQIAQNFSVSLSLVKERVCLLKQKIPGRGRFNKKYNLDPDKIRDQYNNEKKSMREIAKNNGCSKWAIQDLIKKQGIKTRNAGSYPHPLQGKIMSEGSRRKMSIAKLKIPEEQWKGFSIPRSRKLNKSPEWNSWRKQVFKRDNFTCLVCGSRQRLQGHHIIRRAMCPRLTYSVSNGITLCFSCHKAIYGHEPDHETTFVRLVREQEDITYRNLCSSPFITSKDFLEPQELRGKPIP